MQSGSVIPPTKHNVSKHPQPLPTLQPKLLLSKPSLASNCYFSNQGQRPLGRLVNEYDHSDWFTNGSKEKSSQKSLDSPSTVSTNKIDSQNEQKKKPKEIQFINPFDEKWCISKEYWKHNTPSRLDGVTENKEIQYRRMGTHFIKQMCLTMKLKPICKETAYIYYHRFYCLRSFKRHDSMYTAAASLYLACKYEDHLVLKEFLIKKAHQLWYNKTPVDDKVLQDSIKRLIQQENNLLQVLGFVGLQVTHFQLVIAELMQNKRIIPGTNQLLYTFAYKISSEMNRLTILSILKARSFLVPLAIYIASMYLKVSLPDDWISYVVDKQEPVPDIKNIVKHAENLRSELLANSSLICGELQKLGINLPGSKKVHTTNTVTESKKDKSIVETNQKHSSSTTKIEQLLELSPDSAYSSNSSHSPDNDHDGGGNKQHSPFNFTSTKDKSAPTGAIPSGPPAHRTNVMMSGSQRHMPDQLLNQSPYSECHRNMAIQGPKASTSLPPIAVQSFPNGQKQHNSQANHYQQSDRQSKSNRHSQQPYQSKGMYSNSHLARPNIVSTNNNNSSKRSFTSNDNDCQLDAQRKRHKAINMAN